MLNAESDYRNIIDNPKSIFSLLSKDEKDELEKQISLVQYKKSEVIYKEEERPNCLYMLVDGKVKLCKEGVGGREQIIRMVKPMEIIGFRALFAKENHIASAIALEESLICTVNSEFVMTKAIKNTLFAEQIIKKLSVQLGFSNTRTVTLTQKHIRGRLAESLILLKSKYGYENDGCTLNVYLSREDIANLSNMTTSNAIRTLSTFANEKVIAIDGRKIKILDFNRLDRISKLG